MLNNDKDKVTTTGNPSKQRDLELESMTQAIARRSKAASRFYDHQFRGTPLNESVTSKEPGVSQDVAQSKTSGPN